MASQPHPIYPVNPDVLLVPRENGESYDAVSLRECDESTLDKVQRYYTDYFCSHPEYVNRLPKNSSLEVYVASLRVQSEKPNWELTQRKKFLQTLNRLWYEYEVSKPKLTTEGYQEGVVVESIPVKEAEIALRRAQHVEPGELTRLFQGLNRTYELSVVSPTEVLVVLRNRWACSRMISMRPVRRGSTATRFFWDTDSTISIMRMFVSRYRQDSTLSVPHLRNILTQLEYLVHRPMSLVGIEADSKQYYTFLLAIMLFSLFLYRWQVPCLDDLDCKLRPSVLDSRVRSGRRERK